MPFIINFIINMYNMPHSAKVTIFQSSISLFLYLTIFFIEDFFQDNKLYIK